MSILNIQGVPEKLRFSQSTTTHPSPTNIYRVFINTWWTPCGSQRYSMFSTRCKCTVTPIGWTFSEQPMEAEDYLARDRLQNIVFLNSLKYINSLLLFFIDHCSGCFGENTRNIISHISFMCPVLNYQQEKKPVGHGVNKWLHLNK